MTVLSRTTSLTLGAALLAAPMLLVASSATALPPAPVTCGGVVGAREVASNVCEIAFQSAAEASSFTAPAGISQMGAVLVGAGGGGSTTEDYNGPGNIHRLGVFGGGGGEVRYVSLANSGGTTFTITPGAGGTAANYDSPAAIAGLNGAATTLSWGSTTETAAGGDAAQLWASGNSGGLGVGLPGPISNASVSGGGASGDGIAADYPVDGGAGTKPSALPGVDSALFPSSASELAFGRGGDAWANYGTEVTLDATIFTYANAGFGGNGNTMTGGENGNDGAVYIRWNTTVTAASLASTGANALAPIVIGSSVIVLGAVFLTIGVRSRSRRNK